MKIKIILLFIICGFCNACDSGTEKKTEAKVLGNTAIQHTVMFCLKYDTDAPETAQFLNDAQRILSFLPTVNNFEIKRQISPKNSYDFYFSMIFADSAAYEAYNNHPDHVQFVKERWETEVSDFQEADFILITNTQNQ